MTSSQYADKAQSGIPDGVEWMAWGGARSEGQHRRDWADGGLAIDEPPLKDVEAGIDRATQLIQEDRLRVFRSCKGFRDEIGSYKRKLDTQGNPMDEIEHKRKFHRMDAYRYVASGIIEASGPYVVML